METILCGYGRAGKIHYKNLLNNQNFKLKYIVDITDNLSISENIPIININNQDKFNTILKDKSIKAVFVTTPTKTHYDIVKKSLLNNKHVFVEKPITENIDHINECFEIADKNNLILFVGYNRRYDPIIRNIKSRIDSKK